MKKLLDILTEEVAGAFEKAGYDSSRARVSVSNRPDLCEYQCNGAMALAKVAGKAPFMIAEDVVKCMEDSKIFKDIEVVKPGFINLNVNEEFLASYLLDMRKDDMLGVDKVSSPKNIVIDFGGANVAKPLHVGHLRSAVIGESIKRICRFMGNNVIGDAHLGDWGLQMGLITVELEERKPELPYFDENFEGEYPTEPPFTISELGEIYPCANAKSKEDEDFKEKARKATLEIQNGRRGYRALWKHILNVSLPDLKKNYDNLGVSFDFWGKESDAHEIIPDMVKYLKDGGYTTVSEGALVVEVKEDTDKKEIPPCMILKSNGATLYNTTDLATIVSRMKDNNADHIIYVVDNRQDLYFETVFRCARKTKIVKEDTELTFLGFGTMNGPDGKPFKTRDGGVMRLDNLVNEINEAVYAKIMENRETSSEEAKQTAKVIGLAALKYGDLSNQASKDYVFDINKFISFEGNTGPYILYTIVRIKSILSKYADSLNSSIDNIGLEGYEILSAKSACEKNLEMTLAKFNEVIVNAYEELAPHKICAYIYELSDNFNKFYHETKILSEEDESRKKSYIALINLVKATLEKSIFLLGFEAPDRM
ncbi:arginine--tRNA ligase [uncultured Eubacterium sp.]|uniref:arginine--tRNA ligase n=1 Tax=uncultured Eubacterium sp. TaxID=165185 RepID=UPI00259550C3|nr:arginine--tRNA ligase [uncultured Eubacterium sp.]